MKQYKSRWNQFHLNAIIPLCTCCCFIFLITVNKWKFKKFYVLACVFNCSAFNKLLKLFFIYFFLFLLTFIPLLHQKWKYCFFFYCYCWCIQQTLAADFSPFFNEITYLLIFNFLNSFPIFLCFFFPTRFHSCNLHILPIHNIYLNTILFLFFLKSTALAK